MPELPSPESAAAPPAAERETAQATISTGRVLASVKGSRKGGRRQTAYARTDPARNEAGGRTSQPASHCERRAGGVSCLGPLARDARGRAITSGMKAAQASCCWASKARRLPALCNGSSRLAIAGGLDRATRGRHRGRRSPSWWGWPCRSDCRDWSRWPGRPCWTGCCWARRRPAACGSVESRRGGQNVHLGPPRSDCNRRRLVVRRRCGRGRRNAARGPARCVSRPGPPAGADVVHPL